MGSRYNLWVQKEKQKKKLKKKITHTLVLANNKMQFEEEKQKQDQEESFYKEFREIVLPLLEKNKNNGNKIHGFSTLHSILAISNCDSSGKKEYFSIFDIFANSVSELYLQNK